MKERRFDTRRLVKNSVRLYHPVLGRVDGVMKDISGGGAAIKLNSSKDMYVDSIETPLLLRPINLDVLFPVALLRQTESRLAVQFLE